MFIADLHAIRNHNVLKFAHAFFLHVDWCMTGICEETILESPIPSFAVVSHFLWLLQYQQTTNQSKMSIVFRERDIKDPPPTARKMIINSDIETWQSFFSSTWWATQPTLARCLGMFVIFGTAYCMPASLFLPLCFWNMSFGVSPFFCFWNHYPACL